MNLFKQPRPGKHPEAIGGPSADTHCGGGLLVPQPGKVAEFDQVGCLLVTHDMGVIASVTDRVAVMYMGKLVEIGDTREVLTNHDTITPRA